jgi:hypothetical protein
VALECRLLSFDDSCGCAVGEIINISADESILAENGSVDVKKLDPIAYNPVEHTYLRCSEAVGKAFSDGKKLK